MKEPDFYTKAMQVKAQERNALQKQIISDFSKKRKKHKQSQENAIDKWEERVSMGFGADVRDTLSLVVDHLKKVPCKGIDPERMPIDSLTLKLIDEYGGKNSFIFQWFGNACKTICGSAEELLKVKTDWMNELVGALKLIDKQIRLAFNATAKNWKSLGEELPEGYHVSVGNLTKFRFPKV